MAIQTSHSQDQQASEAGATRSLELAALLKTEAVLRILKGRSTAAEEAARMQVDAATIAVWLDSTFRAISRVLDEGLSRQDADSRDPAVFDRRDRRVQPGGMQTV